MALHHLGYFSHPLDSVLLQKIQRIQKLIPHLKLPLPSSIDVYSLLVFDFDIICINFIGMDETYLDASKIPKFEFEIHNEELTNCIKELHFQFKTQEKKLEKLRKDMELKVQESFLSDLFIELTAGIDIHPSLLKELPARS